MVGFRTQTPGNRIIGKREQNKAANRSIILDAARGCFFKYGFDAITIRDVIRRTGLAAGTFYNYFPDKESLFRALVDERVLALSEEIKRVRREARTLEEFIHGCFLASFEAAVADSQLHLIILHNRHNMQTLYDESVVGLSFETFKDDLRDGVNRGLFPPLDIELVAAGFFGSAFEMSRLIAERRRHSPRAAAQFATRLLLGGVNAFGMQVPKLKPRVRAMPCREEDAKS
ncbi:TetR/AcrR family transcriptional regulator [Algiphilus sp. W345]|uniref:TetR/AcrR family transcriptional regulator n=1 Tax=Banduia mediterranea TaxID=3075609 RepID=A0ABU2WP22_9GAMM|nr:TetR/AcrR family transcriptional regulator [Algiphilus sp. W345]MDT0499270.1 TetR/AcrR family transcriptional regulator [Algiphilus sp. W345]